MRKIGFINHANISDIVQRLSRSVRSGMIAPVVGSGGTGKSRILECHATLKLVKYQ